jgi:hypothetical protein
LTVSGGGTPPAFEPRIVMFPKSRAALLPVLALASLALAQAHAQTPAAAAAGPIASGARPDPTDPKAQVPSASYPSPLRAYQRFAESPVAPWRETNEVVRQRGGWRAYAREVSEGYTALPAAPAASQPVAAAKPASGGHAGHPMK